jgi:hypothetical protein
LNLRIHVQTTFGISAGLPDGERGERRCDRGNDLARARHATSDTQTLRSVSVQAVTGRKIQHQEPPQHASVRLLQPPNGTHNHLVSVIIVIEVC